MCLVLGIIMGFPVKAGEREYFVAVQSEVHRWAMINRINQGRLHRDKHSDCLLTIILSTTVNAHGELEQVSVTRSSGVPVVDRYYTYATQQAARTFPPMAGYFAGSPPARLTMNLQYVLDTSDEQGRLAEPSTQPCEPL